MAVTYLTDEKKQQQTQQAQPQQSYTGMQGVTQNTAQNLGRYQNGYQQSERVNQAQQQLQQQQALKPEGYISKYGDQLDSILQQISSPKGFKYEFNGDPLFRSYADLYTQQGKQAAMNAAGQAAALTGGYGNSYGANAAAQAQQQYLLSLYDKGMDLRDRAYQAHRDQIGDQKDAYSLLAAREAQDYDRYRDAYNDWVAERDYLTSREDTERNFDVSQFNTDRDYWQNLAKQENADYWQGQEFDESKRRYEQDFGEDQRRYEQNFAEDKRRNDRDYEENVRQYEKNFAENQRQFDINDQRTVQQLEENRRQFDAEIAEKQRQFDASLDWDKMSTQQKYAAEYAMQILSLGQMPSEELLQQAGLSASDAQMMMAQLAATGGGGGGGGKSNIVYQDEYGYTYKKNKDGSVYIVNPTAQDPNKTTWIAEKGDAGKKQATTISIGPLTSAAIMANAQNKNNKKSSKD